MRDNTEELFGWNAKIDFLSFLLKKEFIKILQQVGPFLLSIKIDECIL